MDGRSELVREGALHPQVLYRLTHSFPELIRSYRGWRMDGRSELVREGAVHPQLMYRLTYSLPE